VRTDRHNHRQVAGAFDILGEGGTLQPTAISDNAAESNAARVVSEDDLRQPEVTGEAKSFV
jgi:hypothetical protein